MQRSLRAFIQLRTLLHPSYQLPSLTDCTSLCSNHYHFPLIIFQRSLTSKRQATELRPGNIISHNNRLAIVVKHSHAQHGRQLGNVQLELRDLITKAKSPLRVRPGDMLDLVRLEDKTYQYLYSESSIGDNTSNLYCMDPDTFEQISIEQSLFLNKNTLRFLLEGSEITLSFHEGEVVSAGLKEPTIGLKVTEAAPTMKGESAQSQYKRAVVETGTEVMVPTFVVAGDTIIVDVETGEFVRRG